MGPGQLYSTVVSEQEISWDLVVSSPCGGSTLLPAILPGRQCGVHDRQGRHARPNRQVQPLLTQNGSLRAGHHEQTLQNADS